jgi:isoleucyl-tRNA synthetase
MKSLALGLDRKQALELRGEGFDFVKNAEILETEYKHIPRNRKFDLDLHRPFIDDFVLQCSCGGKMERVPEVFDCWFESGSMPYASNHYPYGDIKKFDPRGNLLKKPVGYPARFIAEGLDQTRGWFYSMIVLGTSLFGKSPYENVVVNGTVLAENGEKMSKRLKNYPDPLYVVDKYGADSLRYYLLSSPVVHAEDLKFSEKGVDEVSKKVISRLDNVLSFYKLYQSGNDGHITKSSNVLDLWILKRLSETIKNIGQSLEKYELDRASRPILVFIEDLSVWYLRRSRDRFKSDNKKDRDYALNTTRIVLVEFSKAIAPFLPFYAEYLYKEAGGKLESVHLETWPNFKVNTEDKLLEKMEKTRAITSTALEKRAKANIKTRQPLSKITLKDKTFSDERFLSIIKDEVNVKEIVFDIKLESDLILDTEITEALKEEGTVRDIIRAIQEARKNNSLTIKDVAFVTIDCNLELKNAIEKNKEKIIKSTLTSEIKFENLEGVPTIETDVGPLRIKFSKN